MSNILKAIRYCSYLAFEIFLFVLIIATTIEWLSLLPMQGRFQKLSYLIPVSEIKAKENIDAYTVIMISQLVTKCLYV